MGTMTISLPDDISDYVEAQVGEDFADSSAFLADLVRRDQAERDAEMSRFVEEARAGGMSDRTVHQIFDDAVERVRARGTLRD